MLQIVMGDEGPGFHDTENLFVPFGATKGNGSGIGLAPGRRVAEGHRRGLVLEKRGDGPETTARLSLPASSTTEGTPPLLSPQRLARLESGGAPSGGRRIRRPCRRPGSSLS